MQVIETNERRRSEQNALILLSIWLIKNDYIREQVETTLHELGEFGEITEEEVKEVIEQACAVAIERNHVPS